MLTYEISRLFALDVVENGSAKNYIDWAMDALQKGSPETSIAILAGLSPATTYFEAKECFLQAIVELGIEEPKIGDKPDIYIETAAKEILAGNIHYGEFLEFVRRLPFESVASPTKYNLNNLSMLQHAIADLGDEDGCWSFYYEDLNVLNPAQTVKIECQILLGILNPEASPRYAQEQRMALKVLAGNQVENQMNINAMNLAINDSMRLPIMMIVMLPIPIWWMVGLFNWLQAR